MEPTPPTSWIAFAGARRIAVGDPCDVAEHVKRFVDAGEDACVLVFDAITSEPVELDLRGSVADVRARLETPAAPAGTPRRAPGRPKLGVVAREVTLLPRHWEWLGAQPGGASVTLRKLVEEARRAGGGEERRREARERAYRFMTAVAGDERGYEEALRALFAGDAARFETETASWPADVRDHARELAAAAFGGEGER